MKATYVKCFIALAFFSILILFLSSPKQINKNIELGQNASNEQTGNELPNSITVTYPAPDLADSLAPEEDAVTLEYFLSLAGYPNLEGLLDEVATGALDEEIAAAFNDPHFLQVLEDMKTSTEFEYEFNENDAANFTYADTWSNLVSELAVSEKNKGLIQSALTDYEAFNAELSHLLATGEISYPDYSDARLHLEDIEESFSGILSADEFSQLIKHEEDSAQANMLKQFQYAEDRRALGFNDLMESALNNETEDLASLIAAGADVNAVNRADDSTALMDASFNGNTESLMLLISAGAELNKKNYQGYTALNLAALNGSVESVKALLEAGADASIKNDLGSSPLMTSRISKLTRSNPNYQKIYDLLSQ